MKQLIAVLTVVFCTYSVLAQEIRIPASYSNLKFDADGRLYFEKEEVKFYADTTGPEYTIGQLLGNPVGTDDGLRFDFGDLNGSVTYGLIPYGKSQHPLPVFRSSKTLENGKAEINIKDRFSGHYDFVGWRETGKLTLGYRVIDDEGMILFDGEVSLSGTGPFEIAPTIYEGPYVSNVTSTGTVIWFETTHPIKAAVEVNGKKFEDAEPVKHHEIAITGLKADTKYDYTVTYGAFAQRYHFKTAPPTGSRKTFMFAYTSDGRHATGGGERMIYGANAYIMKKMAAVASREGAAFVQFTGDMVDGYVSNKEDLHLQLTNWKKSIEAFWHYIPFYVGQGNHEALGYIFNDVTGRRMAFVGKFPFDTQSTEAVMQEAFVNPVNGPVSEDGSVYDPDPHQADFPSYRENVFYYTYGNVAMVVLNSDYWYAPTMSRETSTGGGLHGYLMDQQLAWLKDVITKLEKDGNIDHIFVTQHTPVFPNGGHSKDDMWYSGDNQKRTYVAGKPVAKGIIERRDEYLDILINHSTKVLAVLTGDEHNYNWLKLTADVPIYPENYPFEKLKVSRPIYQINNGASGAPYYGQEQLPWSDHTRSFSVENAVCFFYVDGKRVVMKVLNPDALNQIDEVKLR
jgi:hypothetical protein